MAQEDTATTNELFDSLDLADALEADSSFLDEEDVRPSKRPRFD